MMARLIGLVRPLAGYMVLAIGMGLIGHLCASFITIFGGWAMLDLLGFETPVPLKAVFVCVLVFALVRGVFRYAEQACNHFIAFKLLALLRDRVFRALRRLCPAKLEGRDKGDLISVITSDIELLEVFYAHTISPAVIAALFMPSSLTLATYSLILFDPSRRLYSVCTCKCVKLIVFSSIFQRHVPLSPRSSAPGCPARSAWSDGCSCPLRGIPLCSLRKTAPSSG